MSSTRTWFDVPPAQLDDLVFAIENDPLYPGGTTEKTQQQNGLYTVVGTYPGPDPEIPTEARQPWMEVAKKELEKWKILDQAGQENKIKEYFSTCAGGPTSDLTLWCSAFVNYCIKNAGLHGTNDAGARSWEKWHDGKPVENFVPGCIVVFKRGDKGKGHVGFFVGMDGNRPKVLGGNQGKGHGITLDTPQLEVTAKLMPNKGAVVQTGTSSVGEFSIDTDLKDLRKPCTAQQIDNYLHKRGSPLEGIGAAVIQAATKYHINPVYIVAHAAQETGWGTSPIYHKKNNLFGWGAVDSSPGASAGSFQSREECIDVVMGKVDKLYLTPDGKHFVKKACLGNKMYGMNAKYATDPDWGANIAKIARDIEKALGIAP